jgi:hypothetical protein
MDATSKGGKAMTRQHLPPYAIALAILIVGLTFAGVPWQWTLVGLLLLACPLHFVMMLGGHGGHGGHGGSDQHTDRPDEHQHGPTVGQR